jgi:hypothetical protein
MERSSLPLKKKNGGKKPQNKQTKPINAFQILKVLQQLSHFHRFLGNYMTPILVFLYFA